MCEKAQASFYIYIEASRVVLLAGHVQCVARCTFAAMPLSDIGKCDAGLRTEGHGDVSTSSAP